MHKKFVFQKVDVQKQVDYLSKMFLQLLKVFINTPLLSALCFFVAHKFILNTSPTPGLLQDMLQLSEMFMKGGRIVKF